MKLTGKCKTAFEKWYLNDYTFGISHIAFIDFKELPMRSMQYGVYQDFFQSLDKEFQVYIGPFFNHDMGTMYEWGAWVRGEFKMSHPTPEEARTAAIEGANKYYNENYTEWGS